MEELGLDEPTAEKIVAKCASEAKIVAAEQEAKKAAEAKKKAADRAAFEGGMRSASADPGVNPLLAGDAVAEDGEVARDHTPDGMESASGGSPETIVHDEKSFANTNELSPEEQAVHGQVQASMPGDLPDEDADGAAALAEGRSRPPE
jgi:hypothetical protein